MKKIRLFLQIEFEVEELKDAIANRFPLVELSDTSLERIFVESLQTRIYNCMPEDIDWRIKNDDYFHYFYLKLHNLQEDAEQRLAKQEISEWERGYWKDVGAA